MLVEILEFLALFRELQELSPEPGIARILCQGAKVPRQVSEVVVSAGHADETLLDCAQFRRGPLMLISTTPTIRAHFINSSWLNRRFIM